MTCSVSLHDLGELSPLGTHSGLLADSFLLDLCDGGEDNVLVFRASAPTHLTLVQVLHSCFQSSCSEFIGLRLPASEAGFGCCVTSYSK